MEVPLYVERVQNGLVFLPTLVCIVSIVKHFIQ